MYSKHIPIMKGVRYWS